MCVFTIQLFTYESRTHGKNYRTSIEFMLPSFCSAPRAPPAARYYKRPTSVSLANTRFACKPVQRNGWKVQQDDGLATPIAATATFVSVTIYMYATLAASAIIAFTAAAASTNATRYATTT
jgi:hypothetical protein